VKTLALEMGEKNPLCLLPKFARHDTGWGLFWLHVALCWWDGGAGKAPLTPYEWVNKAKLKKAVDKQNAWLLGEDWEATDD